jgi:ribosome biogenesis GTPase
MIKRRINKRQSARIQQIQAGFRDTPTNATHPNKEGLVIARFGRHAEIEDSDGRRIRCFLRANLEAIVAGDRVVWHAQEEGHGVIVSLCPRTSLLGRPAHRLYKPVAANITQLMIVIAPKPELSWSLLDSYLVVAENLQLNATIVLNKVDIPCERIIHALRYYSQSLGYTTVFTSQNDAQGFAHLEATLQHHTSVFVGQSGVGKSSLISGILEHTLDIPTSALSTIAELGRHTTSNSRLYHLPKGGALIDSPGVREFGLGHMPAVDILYGFREFRTLPAFCKFRNCNHQDTPDCAIIQACNANSNLQRRYASFITLR